MAARRNQTLKEACLTAFPAMIRPVQLLPHKRSGAPTSGEGALSDFAACFESLRRTGQSECELPHILWPSAALLLMKRSLPGPSMPGARIEFFRLSRGTVGGACGCRHYDGFRRPIGIGRPFDQGMANGDLSRETQGPSMAPRPTRQDGQSSQMEPRPRGSRHETSAAKRSALKLAEAHAWSNRSRGCVSCRPPRHMYPLAT
jgi:hypothetical protein